MEPNEIVLILATEADFPEVIDLANRAYRGTGPEASWNAENVIEGQRTDASLLRDDLASSPGAVLLLWRDQPNEESQDRPLLGCVFLEPADEGAWYLGLLAVDPRQQKRQLGRTLLSAAEEYARVRGALRIRMSVLHVRETLIAWYLRRGYTLTGKTEPFPYGDARFGRPLRDDLYFVALERNL
jgi:ribosomal protein S18 acetylase RimI-like enzyme